MQLAYDLFKFLHILGAIFWIGGLGLLIILQSRLAGEADREAAAGLARHTRFLMTSVFLPAALTTLLAGFGMIGVSGLGMPFWVVWGLAVVAVTLVVAFGVIQQIAKRVGSLVAQGGPELARVPALRRQMGMLGMLNLVLLLSAVWAMVFKPTF